MINPEDKAQPESRPARIKKEAEKQPMNTVLFWCFLLSSALLNFWQFISYSTLYASQWVSFGVTVGVTLPTYVVICCLYMESKCELFRLFILLDNFFACWLTALFGLIGLNNAFSSLQLYLFDYVLISALLHVDLLLCVTGYRLLFRYARWKNWQIVLQKVLLAILLVIMIYFADRVILDPTYPEVVKEFIFIYAFGYFSLYYELYAKFTEIDGTGDLRTNYQPLAAEEEP